MDIKEAARNSLEYLRQNPLAGKKQNLSKDFLMKLGTFYWKHTYKGTEASEDPDWDAHVNLQAWGQEVYENDPELALNLAHMTHIPDANISLMGACRWVDQGLPTIRFGHKRLAALMATNISKDMLQYVLPPWKAFFIEMPPELMYVVSAKEKAPVKGILVHTVFHRTAKKHIPQGLAWNWMLITDTSLTQWSVNASVEILAGLEANGDYWEDFSLPSEDHDQRVNALVGRLICAVCLMMSSPENFKELPPPRKGRSKKKGAVEPPSLRIFTEAQRINVDVRPAVAAYLQGDRTRVPSARTFVMGHFKRQPYGPHSSLRKVIRIEAYWTHGSPTDPIEPKIYKI